MIFSFAKSRATKLQCNVVLSTEQKCNVVSQCCVTTTEVVTSGECDGLGSGAGDSQS